MNELAQTPQSVVAKIMECFAEREPALQCAYFAAKHFPPEIVEPMCLHHYDDEGKVTALVTPSLESYRALLEAWVVV